MFDTKKKRIKLCTVSKHYSNVNTINNIKKTYSRAKKTYQYLTKGYVGSAEQEYKKRKAKFTQVQKEKFFEQKLDEIYPKKSFKLKRFFKIKKNN